MSCELGDIQYIATAIVNKPCSCCIPWSIFPITDSSFFQIRNELDLNQRASILRKPFRNEIFSEKPCELGFLLELPVTGYVPGEDIPITVTLNIKSNHKALSVTSRLIQKITYDSTRVSKVTEKDVNVAYRPLPEDKYYKYTQNLKVPSVQPTELLTVWNWKVEYTLETTIETNSWFSSNPTMEIPITIGTVPFKSSPTAPDRSTSP